MKIESMEQRVLNKPAVLLCDDCIHRKVCGDITNMRAFVVSIDSMSNGYRFGVERYFCKDYEKRELGDESKTEY